MQIKNLPKMDTWHPQKKNGGIIFAPLKFFKGQPLEQDSFFLSFFHSMRCSYEQSCSASSIFPTLVGTCQDIIRVKMNGRDVCTLLDRLFTSLTFLGFWVPWLMVAGRKVLTP